LLVICRLLRLLDLLYLYPRAQTSRYLVAAPRVTINLSTAAFLDQVAGKEAISTFERISSL